MSFILSYIQTFFKKNHLNSIFHAAKNPNIQFVQIACGIPTATVVVADSLWLYSLSASVDCLGCSLFSRAAVFFSQIPV